MSRHLVLFVNSTEPQCGCFQMGRRIGMTLRNSARPSDPYWFEYFECGSVGQLQNVIEGMNPAAVIWNYHPSTLPFAPNMVGDYPAIKHVALVHEIAPESIGYLKDVFPYRMVCDPTFPADNRTLFRSVRHIPTWDYSTVFNFKRFVVGSFGFAVGGKQFAEIIHAAAREFPGCYIRLNIPFAHFGDAEGNMARGVADHCRGIVVNNYPDVCLEVTHNWMNETELIGWLADNHLNAFFYGPNPGRGIASALDYAIAAQRPIAVNGSQMFRHVHPYLGSYPQKSLQECWGHNDRAVSDLYGTWNINQLRKNYEDMMAAIL